MLAAVDRNRPDRLTQNLTPTRYFEGAYLATLIAVLFRIAVGWLDATSKMLEPSARSCAAMVP